MLLYLHLVRFGYSRHPSWVWNRVVGWSWRRLIRAETYLARWVGRTFPLKRLVIEFSFGGCPVLIALRRKKQANPETEIEPLFHKLPKTNFSTKTEKRGRRNGGGAKGSQECHQGLSHFISGWIFYQEKLLKEFVSFLIVSNDVSVCSVCVCVCLRVREREKKCKIQFRGWTSQTRESWKRFIIFGFIIIKGSRSLIGQFTKD